MHGEIILQLIHDLQGDFQRNPQHSIGMLKVTKRNLNVSNLQLRSRMM